MSTKVANNGFKGNVLIIGGGIGGNALALFLQKAGIDCTVYEAYGYRERTGGGLGLAPNGMNVLAALGLADEAKKRGSLALENTFHNAHGRVLARVKNGDETKYGQPGLSIMRFALYDILNEGVQERGVQVEFGKRLVSITQTATKVTAHFEDGTSAEGDLLIGADGIHSTTRHLALPKSPEPGYVGIIGIGANTPTSAVSNLTERDLHSFHFVFGAKGFFGYAASAPGEIMWWANLPSEHEMTREQLRDLSLEKIQQEMLAIYGGYYEPIPTLIRNSYAPVKNNIHDIQSLEQWSAGRVLLIGDAAHAVSPNAGQGASQALEDAILLAKMLRDCGDNAQMFAQFEAERKPRVERIVAEGRRQGDNKQTVNPFQERIREVMMSVFAKPFMERQFDWLFRYKIAWE